MSDEPSPEQRRRSECQVLEARMRLAIRIYDFKPQERLVLDFLVDRTYGRGVERTLLPTKHYLSMATGAVPGDAGRVLQWLEDEYGVIGSGPAPEFVSRRFQEPLWVWFLPHPAQWRNIAPRVDGELLAQLHRDLDFIEGSQGRLRMADGREFAPPPQMPGLKDHIATSTREDALHDERLQAQIRESIFGARPVPSGAADAPEVCGNSADQGRGNPATSAEIPNTSPTSLEIPKTSCLSTSRAPEHVHVPTALPKHDHDHARRVAEDRRSLRELEESMDDGQLHLLDQATEVGDDKVRAFRKTWAMRILDGQRAAVSSAVGEVKHRKLLGERFLKGPGETMNDLFHRLKSAGRKAAVKR